MSATSLRLDRHSRVRGSSMIVLPRQQRVKSTSGTYFLCGSVIELKLYHDTCLSLTYPPEDEANKSPLSSPLSWPLSPCFSPVPFLLASLLSYRFLRSPPLSLTRFLVILIFLSSSLTLDSPPVSCLSFYPFPPLRHLLPPLSCTIDPLSHLSAFLLSLSLISLFSLLSGLGHRKRRPPLLRQGMRSPKPTWKDSERRTRKQRPEITSPPCGTRLQLETLPPAWSWASSGRLLLSKRVPYGRPWKKVLC